MCVCVCVCVCVCDVYPEVINNYWRDFDRIISAAIL